MQLEEGKIVRMVHPVYGMTAAPYHWFKTYTEYHREKLTMKGATLDPCLVYCRSAAELDGVIGILVYDIIFAASRDFAGKEERCWGVYQSKGRIEIGRKPERFNSVEISICSEGQRFTMNQSDYIKNVKIIKISNNIALDIFRSKRAQYAVAAFSTVTQVLLFVAMLF